MNRHSVFVAGATGDLGRRVIPALLSRGHSVRALSRRDSESRIPHGAEPVIGEALEAASFADGIAPAETFLQLVGVAHPSPSKAALFRSVDLASAIASADAAREAGISHFVYVSDTARRLGLVTIRQMAAAIVHAVENPADGIRVVEAPEIRRASL